LTGLMARLILEHAQISSPALRTEAGRGPPIDPRLRVDPPDQRLARPDTRT
jgi:hypothetical protein